MSSVIRNNSWCILLEQLDGIRTACVSLCLRRNRTNPAKFHRRPNANSIAAVSLSASPGSHSQPQALIGRKQYDVTVFDIYSCSHERRFTLGRHHAADTLTVTTQSTRRLSQETTTRCHCAMTSRRRSTRAPRCRCLGNASAWRARRGFHGDEHRFGRTVEWRRFVHIANKQIVRRSANDSLQVSRSSKVDTGVWQAGESLSRYEKKRFNAFVNSNNASSYIVRSSRAGIFWCADTALEHASASHVSDCLSLIKLIWLYCFTSLNVFLYIAKNWRTLIMSVRNAASEQCAILCERRELW